MPFVNTSDIDMHYETGGRGKSVLVFVHGNFASWRWWQPVLKDLSGGYRAYAPDMRGCGDSDRPADGYTIAQHADDLDHFIRALELPRLHLVGHSLGGCVAMEYALSRPKHLKTLTLVAPAPAEGQTVLQIFDMDNEMIQNAGIHQRKAVRCLFREGHPRSSARVDITTFILYRVLGWIEPVGI